MSRTGILDPKAQTAGQARRLARRALARWGLEELTDSVELLVSEVVTNAVRYAERPVTLRLLRTDVLRCEVGDDVPQLPRLRQARAIGRGRARAVPGQPAGAALGRDPAEHGQGRLVRAVDAAGGRSAADSGRRTGAPSHILDPV